MPHKLLSWCKIMRPGFCLRGQHMPSEISYCTCAHWLWHITAGAASMHTHTPPPMATRIVASVCVACLFFYLVVHVPYAHRAVMACVSDLLFQNTASATSEYGACFHIIAYSLVTCTRTCSRAHEPTATTACVCVSTCARLASVFSDDDYPRIPRSTAADRAKRSSG